MIPKNKQAIKNPPRNKAHLSGFILSLKRIRNRILVTVILSILGCWTVYYAWPQRSIRYENYTYSDKEAQRLRFYPKALYAHGMHAWFQHQPETAMRFFRQAVSEDPLFLDAWLRLAEIQAAIGQDQTAKEILTFTTHMTDKVFRWKWPQLLLARELDMPTRFCGHANDLLSHNVLQQDVLQLLHTHFIGNASAVISVLDSTHLADYLDWLIQWGMLDESLTVWSKMTEILEPDKALALRYAHFLLSHKRVKASTGIWQAVVGSDGLTNPGFEKNITGQGFDWRYWGEKDGRWGLKRVNGDTAEGEYALRITFNGQENLSFHHLLQIVPVSPKETYQLTYAWKSRGITTDQGLFVEIYSYDSQGLYRKSPMMTGTHGWRTHTITFETPEDGHAVVLRLRRQTSNRFDSKIKGMVWMDDFQLEKTNKPRTTTVEKADPFHKIAQPLWAQRKMR